jgi:predicted TIM-barrel fold metal-dependent hydrolase
MSDRTFNRRDVLGFAVSAAASASLAVLRSTPCRAETTKSEESSNFRTLEELVASPIIDTHQHLWDLKKYKLPWVKRGDLMDRDYLEADYLRAVEGLNVVKTVYMEVDVDPSQQLAESEEVTAICASGSTLMKAAVVSGRPASPGFADYAARFRGDRYIKGLRQVLHGPNNSAGFCLKPEFIAGIGLLGELGLSFDLCMRPGELGDAAKLVDQCPDTRFILDHCGNPDVQAKDNSAWKRSIDELAKRDRVVCKVSGLVESAKHGAWSADDLAPYVNHVIEAFGWDRVIFAGNWPVCTVTATFAEWVNALKTIVHDRPLENQKKLFHDNAVRLYDIK